MLTSALFSVVEHPPSCSDMKGQPEELLSLEHIPHTLAAPAPGSCAFNSGIMQQINYEYVYNTLPMLLAYTRLQEQQKQQKQQKQQAEMKRERSERKTATTWAQALKLNVGVERQSSSDSSGCASAVTPLNQSIEENSQLSGGESGFQSESVSPALTVDGVQTTTMMTSGSRPASRQLHAPAPLPLHGEEYQVSKMDVLSEQIWHYHMSLTQSEALLNRKLQLRDLLYFTICPVFP
uniref:Uncharacterized protein n=1 Tax=Plectus sambesii TaxID=2011161 RepID=A0A914VQ19_9BILA